MDTFGFGAGHSRRDFMRNLAIFGIASAGLPGLSGMALAQGAPTPGGVMSLVTSGDPPNFDPFSNTTSYVLHIVAACYNSLLMMDPENPDKIVGDLATGWTQSDDGLSYTFTLVNNAKFHDGKPLTSADVKYTFDIVRDPPEGVVSARKSLLAAISSIDAVDDYTVRFNLSRPSPGLLASLATGWFIVAPEAHPGGQGNHGGRRHRLRAFPVQGVHLRRQLRDGAQPRLPRAGPAVPRRAEVLHRPG